MTDVKKYSCSNCNKMIEAYPPDDVYTKAMIKKCFTCQYNKKTIIERIVECENCDHQNIFYWHQPFFHTVGETQIAKANRNKELGIFEESPKRKTISFKSG
mgnify:FL=1